MAILIDPERTKALRAAPRLMQILRVLARHKFLGTLFGRVLTLTCTFDIPTGYRGLGPIEYA